MANDLTKHRMPWEPAPIEETITAMQRDMTYMVKFTGVVVHSNRPELRMMINTERGQIVPRGEVRFTDGTTLELQDIGMPQVGAQLMTVEELTSRLAQITAGLGLTQ
jgi:hypothetical protein